MRGNFKTTPETILEQIPLQSGGYLTTTAVERGQRNLGFLQLFNNATPISFPGRDEKPRGGADGGRGRGALRAIQRRSTRAPACRPIRSRRRLGAAVRRLRARRLREPQLLGPRLELPPPTSPTARRCCAAISNFLDRRFLGTLFRFDIALNYLQQETVRLGDIRSGAGSIGFSREMYPGVDAGIHYNLRNTTHTEPLIRVAGPDETITSVRLGTTVGSLSANVEWLRMDNRLVPTRGFRINALAELALPVAVGAAAPVPARRRRRHVPEGQRPIAVGAADRALSVCLRLGFRFEQGFPLGGASLLPKVERYFAGGDTTIRGYQLDRARIELVRYLDPSFATGDVYRVDYRPLGGNLRILQNIDLMFPISPPWYGSVFLDNGVVADSLDGLSLDQVPPRRRRVAAADPAADRRHQPGLGLAARPGPRRHQDRRLPRQRRPVVLERTLGGSICASTGGRGVPGVA